MKRLKPKQDVYMEDREFHNELKIKRLNEEDELFELIMDSVCNEKGKVINKGVIEKEFKLESELFREHMKDLKVKPFR